MSDSWAEGLRFLEETGASRTDAIILSKAGKQTRHWTRMGNVQSEIKLEEGKFVNCVWMSSTFDKDSRFEPKLCRPEAHEAHEQPLDRCVASFHNFTVGTRRGMGG